MVREKILPVVVSSEYISQLLYLPDNSAENVYASFGAITEIDYKQSADRFLIRNLRSALLNDKEGSSENKLSAIIICPDCLNESKDLAKLDTNDFLFVIDLENYDDLEKILGNSESKNLLPNRSYQKMKAPWGSHSVLYHEKNFKIKLIEVNPGGSLSLQMHDHRSEYWIVAKGYADVIRGTEKFVLAANQSIYIPIKEKHRLSNTREEPLALVEIQSGRYLSEDDIVRFEDIYGRILPQKRDLT